MATTETFLECAAPLILRKGLRGTGVNEIIAATGLTKGAFYYYFKDKSDFYRRYIQYAGRCMLGLLKTYLDGEDTSSSRRLMGFFQSRAMQFERGGFVGGCPLGNMSQELPDGLPELKGELEKAFGEFTKAVGGALENCRADGLLRMNGDAGLLAEWLVFAWQGALMHAKLYQRFNVLDTFLNLHFGPPGWFEDRPYTERG